MEQKFDRRYSLIIGRAGRLIKNIIPGSIVSPVLLEQNIPSGSTLPTGDYLDFAAIPNRFTIIKDLQFTATVNSNKEESVPAILKVYNMSEDTLKRIREDDTLILKAGYKGDIGPEDSLENLPTIFIGQIAYISTYQEDQDSITTIVCGDSLTVKKNIKVTKSWPPGTLRSQVVEDLVKYANSKGVPTGDITSVTVPRTDAKNLIRPFLGGWSVSGWLFDELETLCDALGLRFFTSLGRIYIQPKTAPKSETISTVRPNNIKGRIKPESDNVKDLSANKKSSGIKVTLFMDGRINITQVLRLVDCDDYDGEYIIDSMKFEMDYRGDDWHIEVSCTKL